MSLSGSTVGAQPKARKLSDSSSDCNRGVFGYDIWIRWRLRASTIDGALLRGTVGSRVEGSCLFVLRIEHNKRSIQLSTDTST